MLIESNQRIRNDVDDGGCHDVHHVGVDVGIYSLIVPFVLLDISSASNCTYCSYGNGLLAYACETASRTERYWCPIKHARRIIGA